jgi:hypothetical protein
VQCCPVGHVVEAHGSRLGVGAEAAALVVAGATLSGAACGAAGVHAATPA